MPLKSTNKKSKNSKHSDVDLLFKKYQQELDDWPSSWEIEQRDREVGKAITKEFTSFLLSKIQQGRAKRTLNNYTRYLWILGGELIRQINDYEPDRKLSARELILDSICGEGGPLWLSAFDEDENKQFDAVCRMLYKFMTT